MIGIESRISIPSEILFHELDGEAVLLNLHSGKYFGLDSTGTHMWNLLVRHGTLAAAYQTLLDEYDVDEARLKADLLALVNQLAVNGLIQLDSPSDSHES